MARCANCGNENRAGARYCWYCGEVVKNEQADQEQTEGLQTIKAQDIGYEISPETLVEGLILPIRVGSYIRDRYKIINEPTASEERYLAEDHLKCWNCQAEQTTPSQEYCEICGIALTHWPEVYIHTSLLQDNSIIEENSDNYIIDGVVYHLEMAVSAPDLVVKTEKHRLQFGFGIHPGLVRENNEDSLLLLNLSNISENQNPVTCGLFAVADGIGGHDSGEIASKYAVNGLTAAVMREIVIPAYTGDLASADEIERKFEEAVVGVNQTLLDLKAQILENDMGCTLTAVLIVDWFGFVANIGDSRTYLMRAGELRQITEDHSMVAKLVSLGIIQPEEVNSHESRNLIFRSLGTSSDLQIDMFRIALDPEDRIILCSDGLWEMIDDMMIEEVLLEYFDPQLACDRLVDLANRAGGRDNISVITVNLLG